jgi:hypothetical protein
MEYIAFLIGRKERLENYMGFLLPQPENQFCSQLTGQS